MPRNQRLGGHGVQLTHTFVLLFDVGIEVLGNMSVICVFIAVTNNQSPSTGNRTGRNAGSNRCITNIVLIGVRGDASINRTRTSIEFVDGLLHILQELVREYQNRRLILMSRFQRPSGQVITLLDRTRCEDRPGKLAVSSPQRKKQILLGGAGGQPGRRSRTLGDEDDNRKLHHSGQAQPLDHQRKTAAAGHRHRWYTRIRCPANHVYSRDLVLCLLHDNSVFVGDAGEVSESGCGGRHRIGRDEFNATDSRREPGGGRPIIDVG